MSPVRLGSWNELRSLAAPLRQAVFIDEQNVPADLEWDEDDAACVHAVVLAPDRRAAATGRLLPAWTDGADAGMSRIGRMAVQRELRGTGLGGQVIDALLLAARQRGDAGVLLHAQCHATGFYAGRGFVARGDTFDEAGIEHVEMLLRF